MSNEKAGLYRRRIGVPRTDDEIRGYWMFVVGLLTGAVGIALLVLSQPAGPFRKAGIFFGAVGLALLIAGPVIRLPLRRMATSATYLGLVISVLAIVWFVLAFPGDWSPRTGHAGIITLYAVGLAIIGLGGVGIPLLTEATAAVDARVAESEQDLASEREETARLESDLASERAETERDARTAAAEREDLEARLAGLRRSQAQFEVYEDGASEFRWRLRHRNGNIIADSSEGYTRKHNAQKGMQSVRANALGAAVVDATVAVDDGRETVPLLADLADDSQATFDIYEDGSGEFRWRLVHENGNILADSGEGYTRRHDAERAVEGVKHNAGQAAYLAFDPTSFEVYRDGAGEWRWRLVHKNGNILADSGEGYTRRRDARRAAESVRGGIGDADVEA
jgi:uncharacterized protein YegP (UPF0339 family)